MATPAMDALESAPLAGKQCFCRLPAIQAFQVRGECSREGERWSREGLVTNLDNGV